MARNIDYSVQLPLIGNPVESRAGQLYEQAGHYDGRANAIGGAATAGALSFLGTQALEGYKGKLEANETADIQDAIDRLEGFGPKALDAQQNMTDLAQQIETFKGQAGDMTPAQVADFGREVQRFANAQKQGVLSKADVINRIDAAVKKYSAAMPGWAGEFRKTAAEMISGPGAIGLHQALFSDKQSMSEWLAKKQIEQRMSAIADIAKEQGVLPEQVTPQMLQVHYQQKQVQRAADDMKKRIDMGNMTQEEADKSYGQIVGMQIMDATAGLAQKFARLGVLNSDPAKAVESNQFALELGGELTMIQNTLERSILEMTKPVPGRPALSMKQAQEQITQIKGMLNNYQDSIKTMEGRNMLAAVVKAGEGNVSMILNGFMAANPHVAVLNRLGVASELFKAYVAIGNDKEFGTRFPGLTPAMSAILRFPEQHANLIGNASSGQGVDMNALRAFDPKLADVVSTDLALSVQTWLKDPNATDQKKLATSNQLAVVAQHLNPVKAKDMEWAAKLLADKEAQAGLQRLTPQQRANALLPLAANIEQSYLRVGEQVHAEIATFNKLAERSGATLSLGFNKLSGQFEVVEGPKAKQSGVAMTETPGGAVVGANLGAVSAVPMNANDARKRADDLTGRLNTMLETYTAAVRQIKPEGAPDISDVRTRAFESISSGQRMPLFEGLPVPKNTSGVAAPALGNFDVARAVGAVEFAEGSGDSATSPKGARGRHQFMVDTAKRFGLKVDPASGLDERTDPTKSAAAASRYLSELHSMFNGDMEKVAASYNAGEGVVKQAVDRAASLGIPDQWKGVLAGMGKGYAKETLPYINKFMSKYGSTQVAQR